MIKESLKSFISIHSFHLAEDDVHHLVMIYQVENMEIGMVEKTPKFGIFDQPVQNLVNELEAHATSEQAVAPLEEVHHQGVAHHDGIVVHVAGAENNHGHPEQVA